MAKGRTIPTDDSFPAKGKAGRRQKAKARKNKAKARKKKK
jgi:hypothetical protein